MGSFLHIYDRLLLPSFCLSRLLNIFIHLTEQILASRIGGSPIVPRNMYFYRACFSCLSFHLRNGSVDNLFAPSLLILEEVCRLSENFGELQGLKFPGSLSAPSPCIFGNAEMICIPLFTVTPFCSHHPRHSPFFLFSLESITQNIYLRSRLF